MHRLLLLFILFLLLSDTTSGQAFKFKRYGEQQGIDSRYINTLVQGTFGRLYIGTGGEGLYRFDGLRFKSITTRDSLADNMVECSALLSDGSLLFGHGNGMVSRIQGDRVIPMIVDSTFRSRITEVLEDANGNLWFASQNNGIVCSENPGTFVLYAEGLEDYNVYSLLVHRNQVWIGTDMGMLRGTWDGRGRLDLSTVDEIPMTGVRDIALSRDGQLFVATEDQGLYRITILGGHYHVMEITFRGNSLREYFIHQVRAQPDGSIWLSTNAHGLVELSDRTSDDFFRLTNYYEQGATTSFSARCSFHDREGNLWVGTIGDGMLRLEDDFFSTTILDPGRNPTIYSLCIADSVVLAGLSGAIAELDLEGRVLRSNIDLDGSLSEAPVTALTSDGRGGIWAGTINAALWFRPAGARSFRSFTLSDDLLSKRINALAWEGDLLLVGTDNGVYLVRNYKVENRLTIEDGLGGNVVRAFFTDSRGRIWIGTTTSALNYFKDGELHNVNTPVPNTSYPVRSITEDLSGRIWAGTEGFGVIALEGAVARGFRKEDGLYSDFCYSLITDYQGELWVGHRGAVSVIDLKINKISIKNPGKSGDVMMMENAVCQAARYELFFGTSFGLLRYNASLDKVNPVPPAVVIDQILLNEKDFSGISNLTLSAGDYKLEILYSGISLRNAEGVTFQYMLEGYDNNWSLLTSERKAIYNHLPAGTYTFRIRAFNSDGVAGEEITAFTLVIARPFWQQAWFISIVLVLIVVTVRFIIYRRERFLKANQEYLKNELAARTREVVEQKELLEITNKDITDSIVYAKNIQRAVLPAQGEIGDLFPDSFVYYKPRDIVSGDFYWVGGNEERVLIACADCTGHGVPGAFMSLIGSLLMKEVISDPDVNGPHEFLLALHRSLNKLLRSRSGSDGLADSMDVSVIEINSNARELRVASANRPVLLSMNGKLTELRGDRRTVGGGLENDKPFTCHEFPWNPGDQAYLFSDGVTDQFGGPAGKKLKRSGLIRAIDEIRSLPMAEQRRLFKQYFQTWKGTLPQLDDVIMIGIRA